MSELTVVAILSRTRDDRVSFADPWIIHSLSRLLVPSPLLLYELIA